MRSWRIWKVVGGGSDSNNNTSSSGAPRAVKCESCRQWRRYPCSWSWRAWRQAPSVNTRTRGISTTSNRAVALHRRIMWQAIASTAKCRIVFIEVDMQIWTRWVNAKMIKEGGRVAPEGVPLPLVYLSISRQFCHFHSARRDAIRKQKWGLVLVSGGQDQVLGRWTRWWRRRNEGDPIRRRILKGISCIHQDQPILFRFLRIFFPVDPTTTLLLLFSPSRIQRLSGTTLMILLELKGFVWINFYSLFTTHFVHICLFTLCRDCHLITSKLSLGEWVGKTKTLRWHILKNMCQIWWEVASVSPILVAIK